MSNMVKCIGCFRFKGVLPLDFRMLTVAHPESYIILTFNARLWCSVNPDPYGAGKPYRTEPIHTSDIVATHSGQGRL